MTLVQDRNHFRIEHLFITLLSFFPTSELNDKLSDQFAGPLGLHLIVITAAALFSSKYIEEDLQQIFKTVLEV